jgi:hypothetical protein
MSISTGVDLVVIYKIIKALATPFNETEAYDLGLIDEKGKKLRSAKTREEKNAMTYFDRFVFNIKRILSKFGLSSKIGTMAAALFLLKEGEAMFDMDDREVLTEIKLLEKKMEEADISPLLYIAEEITNSTGAAVVGTGDTGVDWVDRKKKRLTVGERGNRKHWGRYINAAAYIKRAARKSNKT